MKFFKSPCPDPVNRFKPFKRVQLFQTPMPQCGLPPGKMENAAPVQASGFLNAVNAKLITFAEASFLLIRKLRKPTCAAVRRFENCTFFHYVALVPEYGLLKKFSAVAPPSALHESPHPVMAPPHHQYPFPLRHQLKPNGT